MPEFNVYDVLKLTYCDLASRSIEAVVLKKYQRTGGAWGHDCLVLKSERLGRPRGMMMLYRSDTKVRAIWLSTIVTRAQEDKDLLLEHACDCEQRFRRALKLAEKRLQEAEQIAGHTYTIEPRSERIITLGEL